MVGKENKKNAVRIVLYTNSSSVLRLSPVFCFERIAPAKDCWDFKNAIRFLVICIQNLGIRTEYDRLFSRNLS